MAITNANSSKQGYDSDHASNPYHETIQSHGYAYSHSTPVIYSGIETVIHHTYKHSLLKDHVVGIWHRDGSAPDIWYFDAHKLGSAGGRVREGYTIGKFLKAHVARAKRKADTNA